MGYIRYAIRRVVFAVLSVYATVTAVFLAVTLGAALEINQRLALARYQGTDSDEVERLEASLAARRNLDEPLYSRYLDWLIDVSTFQWGDSLIYDQSVISVLDGRVQTTLGYVVPGVVLGVGLGVGLGAFVAFRHDGVLDWSTRVGAYALLGVPSFMLVLYAELFGIQFTSGSATTWLAATLAVAAAILAGQLRFARMAMLAQTGQAFMKVLRAKGASRWQLMQHVFRNASLQVVSISISDLLSVMVLTLFVVEEVLPIDGLAAASLRAALESDTALVIWTTLVVVFLGVAGNLLKDLLYGYLDPRIRAE